MCTVYFYPIWVAHASYTGVKMFIHPMQCSAEVGLLWIIY